MLTSLTLLVLAKGTGRMMKGGPNATMFITSPSVLARVSPPIPGSASISTCRMALTWVVPSNLTRLVSVMLLVATGKLIPANETVVMSVRAVVPNWLLIRSDVWPA